MTDATDDDKAREALNWPARRAMLGRLNTLMEAIVTEKGITDTVSRNALALSYATEFLGVMIAAASGPELPNAMSLTRTTVGRLASTVIEARLSMNEADAAEEEAKTATTH